IVGPRGGPALGDRPRRPALAHRACSAPTRPLALAGPRRTGVAPGRSGRADLARAFATVMTPSRLATARTLCLDERPGFARARGRAQRGMGWPAGRAATRPGGPDRAHARDRGLPHGAG